MLQAWRHRVQREAARIAAVLHKGLFRQVSGEFKIIYQNNNAGKLCDLQKYLASRTAVTLETELLLFQFITTDSC